MVVAEPFRAIRIPSDSDSKVLWMDELLRHFETMGKMFVHIRRGIKLDFVHPQYVPG